MTKKNLALEGVHFIFGATDVISLTPRFNGVIGVAGKTATVSTVSRAGHGLQHFHLGPERGKPLKRFPFPHAPITPLKRAFNESFAKSAQLAALPRRSLCANVR